MCIRVEFVRFDLEYSDLAWVWVWRVPNFPDPLTRNVLRKMRKPPETRDEFARRLFIAKSPPHYTLFQNKERACGAPGTTRYGTSEVDLN